MKILPRTRSGKWSIILILLFVLMLLVFFVMVNVFNQRGGDTFFSNLLLTLPMLIALGSAAASCIVGIVSFIKSKEKALLVFLSVVIGLIVTVYGVLEICVPH